MIPESGDIWQWTKQSDEEEMILIISYSREETNHGEVTKHYYGLDLLYGYYDYYIFNNSNMEYWRKLA